MNEKKKILIIDDDEDICVLIQSILMDDFDVDFAITGHEGLARLRTRKYDLVLLDIMMPELNGYEVFEMIKDEFGNIDIIFITAKDSMADMILGFKRGAARYITKPINTEELIREIKTTLKIH